jgi:hypothetical protein
MGGVSTPPVMLPTFVLNERLEFTGEGSLTKFFGFVAPLNAVASPQGTIYLHAGLALSAWWDR